MTTPDLRQNKQIPKQILSVSELNRLAKEVLELSFPLFWVSGEISNFTRAASGHWYFSLKDKTAQVKCVMFKGRNAYTDFIPREGDNIEARCTVTLYEARGDFQLTVESIQKAGLGALFETFEKLKIKLAHEGLFDATYKKAIPTHPQTIGIVTSPDAAALQDVLSTLKRRNPNIDIIIYPTPVQGKGAAALIAKAIHTASQRSEVDTLIICRGGGSMEDLWQFNEEVVARAIDDCPIPTISGVGHETDFTITDFVADVRAATPTAAAELACADLSALKNKLDYLQNQLENRMLDGLNQRQQTLDYLAKRLISPSQQIVYKNQQIQQLKHRFNMAMQQQLRQQQNRLINLSSGLTQLSPQAVLSRGYALIQDQNGHLLSSQQQFSAGQNVLITLHDGVVPAQINQ